MQIRKETEWIVTGNLFGKAKRDAPGDFHRAKDISGIACDRADGFPRNGLVIDDELQAAQLVIVKDGELIAGDRVPLITDMFDGVPIELDGEGVAFADGYFYVIGSHGHPRDKGEALDPVRDAAKIAARIRACSRVFRISAQVPREIKGTDALKGLLRALPEIAPFVDQPLDKNGLTIEGLAVRGPRAYVGLRSPLVSGKAGIVSASLAALFDDSPIPDTVLAIVDLGPGRGVRDIAFDGANFLVLAGPSSYEEVSFAIYEWDGAGPASLVVELQTYSGPGGETWKPEGLLALSRTAEGRRVLVLFDSAVGGAPREYLGEIT